MQKRIVCRKSRDILAEICWRRRLKIYFFFSSLTVYIHTPPFIIIPRVTTQCPLQNRHIAATGRLAAPWTFTPLFVAKLLLRPRTRDRNISALGSLGVWSSHKQQKKTTRPLIKMKRGINRSLGSWDGSTAVKITSHKRQFLDILFCVL